MKTKLFVVGFMVVLSATVLLTACEKKAAKTAESQAAGQAVVYTCPMHPQVISDKPGKCPICGMNLVVKETDGH